MRDEITNHLTIEELSSKAKLSIATIHRLKRAGKIPYFQPAGKGGALRFPADAIEQACSSSAVSPDAATDGAPRRLSGPVPNWRKQQQ
jgi:hypothetical protein